MGWTRRKGSWLGLGVLGLAAALSGCGKELPQSPFDAQGDVVAMQMDVLKLSLWFAIGIGVFVTLALLFVVFRYRQKGTEKKVPEQVHGNHFLEVAWTLIPIVILVIVGIPTVRTAFATKASNDPNALNIKVIGHQWWFEFQYEGSKVVTANEMWIPVGKDVNITLESADVIHSFWIPKLAGKMDIIPGRVNKMWLNAKAADEYYGQCAEFCGTSHANMRFRVKAVPQAEYDAWIAARQQPAKEPTDPDAVAGMRLFMGETAKSKANCIICHTIDGTKAQGKVGPNLTNIGARTTIAAGVLENTEANLKKWIREPQSIKPGTSMSPHPNMDEQELNQLVKYLQGLK